MKGTGFSCHFMECTVSLRSQINLQLPLGQYTFKGKTKLALTCLLSVGTYANISSHCVLNWDITSVWADTPVHQIVIITFMRKVKWTVGKAFIPYIFFKYKYTKNKHLKCHKNTEEGRCSLLPHYIKPQCGWHFLKGRLFEQNCSRKLRLSYS